jgi:hypothetical protein
VDSEDLCIALGGDNAAEESSKNCQKISINSSVVRAPLQNLALVSVGLKSLLAALAQDSDDAFNCSRVGVVLAKNSDSDNMWISSIVTCTPPSG